MGRKKSINTSQADLFNIQEFLATAPCVPSLRRSVSEWKENGYKGITETTRDLINYWFYTDHIINNNIFKYHKAQQESIETLIYVYEVEKIRSRKQLLEKHVLQTSQELRLPPYDEFSRFCIKMATGSGKTKVMALAIAWQYFNAIKEDEDGFAKTFLVLAPNVIVFERLKSDFESGRIFKTDPIFPRHYDLFWDFDFYMRGEGERANSKGALYLTNIQQFYERDTISKSEEPEIMTAILGGKPEKKNLEITDFGDRIAKRKGLLMVVNDEAHHTHDEDNEWNAVIKRLHEKKNLSLQLDLSATPRYSKGSLFAWTIFDYPLKQAIIDGIVKRPIKGISKIQEAKSSHASVRYIGFLTAGVNRWKEYYQQLYPLNKKPILFLMLNNTSEADDVSHWLQTKYPEDFGGDKTLVIHTDNTGEVSKKDLDIARKLARDVDHNKSPINAIVSVLMLREGWDVQNVTVVVGLRPYSSKANILPEQTIGRGLRLMFGYNSFSSYQERVDIIGNGAFLEFVEDLEKLEDLKLETFEIGKDKLSIITIFPDEKKSQMDIGIPELSPILVRKKTLNEEIAEIDVMSFSINPLPLKEGKENLKSFIYEGKDILTDELLFTKEYTIPESQTPEEVIGYYARRITENLKLPSQFAVLVPKLREFFERKAFGKTVNLNDPAVIKAMSSNVANYVVMKEFEKRLRDKIIEEKEPELLTPAKMISLTNPYPFSKEVFESKKSIFNYVACDNKFEYSFAKFLDRADDVFSFAKLPIQFGFSINYTDTLANIRHYFPDFIAKLKNNKHYIIETKGREDLEVAMKDKAAINWCEYATKMTNQEWNYIKVPQKDFERLNPESFEEMETALKGIFE